MQQESASAKRAPPLPGKPRRKYPLLYVDACDILLFKCKEEINLITTRMV